MGLTEFRPLRNKAIQTSALRLPQKVQFDWWLPLRYNFDSGQNFQSVKRSYDGMMFCGVKILSCQNQNLNLMNEFRNSSTHRVVNSIRLLSLNHCRFSTSFSGVLRCFNFCFDDFDQCNLKTLMHELASNTAWSAHPLHLPALLASLIAHFLGSEFVELGNHLQDLEWNIFCSGKYVFEGAHAPGGTMYYTLKDMKRLKRDGRTEVSETYNSTNNFFWTSVIWGERWLKLFFLSHNSKTPETLVLKILAIPSMQNKLDWGFVYLFNVEFMVFKLVVELRMRMSMRPVRHYNFWT